MTDETDDKKPKPSAKTKDTQSILDLAKDRYKLAIAADKSERAEAEHDLRFAINADNCQWDQDVYNQRQNAHPPRPCLVINKIPEKIDQVSGEFKQLRPSIKVSGVDSQSDPITADIIAGTVRHIERNSDAFNAYFTSHDSVLYCGRGNWRIDIEDAEDDPFGIRDIVINRIVNSLSVTWDPGCLKKDKSDAGYVFISKDISEEEYKAEYGADTPIDEWDDEIGSWGDNWHHDRMLRIVEYWWKEKRDKTYYQVERAGTLITVDKLEENETAKQTKTVKVPKVRWAILTVNRILEGPHDDWPIQHLPIIHEMGKEVNINGKSHTRGMTRFAKVPCQMYNYWSSAITEQVALAPKAPYLVTGPMIASYQSIWDSANISNNIYLPYDIDPKAPTLYPKREAPPQLSTAMANELARVDHDIMAAMGLYQASLGDKGDEKSGRAIQAKQQQGTTGAFPFTSSFTTALTYSTKVIIALIPYVYDTERLQRILGEDGEEMAVPINARPDAPIMQDPNLSKKMISQPREGVTQHINDLTVGKYDVAVSIGPSYATQRQETIAMLMDFIKIMPPQVALNIGDLIANNLDMKEAGELRKRLRKMLPPGMVEPEPGEAPPPPQPPDPAILKAQMDAKNKELELKIKEGELEIKYAEQERKEYETKLKGMIELMKVELQKLGMDDAAIMQIMSMANQQQIGPTP